MLLLYGVFAGIQETGRMKIRYGYRDHNGGNDREIPETPEE